jgi:hypothetical protein
MARRKSSRRDPAPAEIVYLCAQIRRGWSELTYRVRAGYGQNYEQVQQQEVWTPPEIKLSELEWPEEAPSG